MRAYRSDWAIFESWCATRGLAPLPATPMTTAAYLTDRIGGRMTNSPQMREAERWAQQQFRDYGLSDVRAEGFEFGRGWSIVRSSARMTAPRPLDLRAIPVAWTP